ncbi:MAG TPA: transglutaminaseTgpA domain-containing protein, partial [Gaiellaceae bacterium]
MRKGLLVAVLASPLIAWSWMRLEDGRDTGQATLMVLLALLPAVASRRRVRVAASVAAFFVAGSIAFSLAPGWTLPGHVLGRFGDGFLEFYDVQVPFDAAVHPRMHGVLLLAVFAFTLVVALAATAYRPGLTAIALVVGVGWPGTLLPGDDFVRGGLLLAAVLAVAALLRRGPVRGVWAALAAGAVVVVAALAATSSPALAKRAFLDWQHWDLYTKPARPVDVSYVWNSSYTGLTFHGKPTTVFRVKAGPQPRYWRVSVLNTVQAGHWIDEVSPEFGPQPIPLGEEGLVPAREQQQDAWDKEQVTIEALRDVHLPGGSVPVQFAAGSSLGDVHYDPTGVAIAEHPLSRGDSYYVWSYAPSPRPAQLAASKPVYPAPIVSSEEYREVQTRVYPRLFGKPGRIAYVRYLMTHYARAGELRPYFGLWQQAERLTAGARSPYAAAVALERWFRYGGNFTYDQHPPAPPPGVEPLEDFVTHTRRGYCQHFAG